MISSINKNRCIVSILVVFLLFILLAGRIIYIVQNPVQSVSAGFSRKTYSYGSGRGQIYDYKLSKLVETKTTSETVSYLGETLGKVSYFTRYNDNQLACHTVGYLDSNSCGGVTGIEKDFNYVLNCGNFKNFNFYTDAKGSLIAKERIKVDSRNYNLCNGVCLSLDKSIQKVCDSCESLLDCGAVVVSDTQGNIRALSSFPTFNPNNLSEYIVDKRNPLFNRTLAPYQVGSVFKVLVCAAALESGISEKYTHNCRGYENCGGVKFRCHNLLGHGKVNMSEALAVSCNCYFIALANKVGYSKVLNLCKEFGLSEPISLSKSLTASAGTLPSVSVLSSPAGLANFSFGQGELTASPVALSRVYQTIANGGLLCEQKLIIGTVDCNKSIHKLKRNKPKRVLKYSTCKTIRNFLVKTVEQGTGVSARPEFVTAGGKTATAQTGKFNNFGKEKLNAWFIGFIPADNPKYVITVLKEGGKSGSADCAPVFKRIADSIYKSRRV